MYGQLGVRSENIKNLIKYLLHALPINIQWAVDKTTDFIAGTKAGLIISELEMMPSIFRVNFTIPTIALHLQSIKMLSLIRSVDDELR